jgi:flagellar hook protein FlgE
MGLTSALNTSVNGLSLNETSIAVIGNNIANAGTNGFKASSVLFTTQLSQTLSVGSAPTTSDGGTDPRQIGLGATVASIQKDFTQGSITNATSPSDMAIQGDGFFILNGPGGDVYTRDGAFTLNSNNQLVSNQGFTVQGYGVDNNFNLITTQLQNINIPLGQLNVAQQTSQVSLNGALLPTGQVGTQGAHLLSDVLGDAGNSNNPATASTLLTDLQDPPGTSAGIHVGDVLQFTPREGGRTLTPASLTVTSTTTLGDLTNVMQGSLGIQSGGGIPNDPNELPAAGQPGVNIVNGQIQVTGNEGTVNDVNFQVGDLLDNNSSLPINFNKDETATGESATTDFVVYDSLGTPLTVNMSAVLESTGNGSTSFRYFFSSADNNGPDTALGSGTITFDSLGKVTGGGTGSFAIDRSNTSAVSPMQVTVDLTGISGISSQSAGSTLSLGSQNGSAPGTLTSFVIDENGVINGVFDNGATRTLGQVVLGRFANSEGLVDAGNGNFTAGVSSGPAALAKPNSFGAGSLRSGAIELSNTDVGQSLVDLITTSTNYQANTRVISVVQQLVNDLLTLGR